MSLRAFFLIFVLLQMPACITIMVLRHGTGSWLFFGAELLMLADIIFALMFYRKVIGPLNTLRSALELLKSQDWNVRLVSTGEKEIDAIAEVFNRMMSMLHSQEVKMREQEHFLQLLVATSPAGIVVLNFDGSVMMVNPAAEALLESKDPERIRALLPASDDAQIALGGKVLRSQRRAFVKESVQHQFYVIEDITQPLAQANKDAYGRVIRVMAHEVNNTVAGLGMALEALPQADDDSRELIDACRHRIYSLGDFVGKYAEVVRLPEAVRAPLDLCASVRTMRPFLQSLCNPRDISLELKIPEESVTVEADGPLIEQVIVNAVKNSTESIGHGGRIEIEVLDSPAGICISDNGAGIAPEKADKLFTPFYTDKPGGKGIGLTFIKEVLVMHNCRYSLTTDSGDGQTRFIFRF